MPFGCYALCVMAHQLALYQAPGSERRNRDDMLEQEGEGGGIKVWRGPKAGVSSGLTGFQMH